MSVLGEKEDVAIDIVSLNVSYPDSRSDTTHWDAPKGTAIAGYRAVERSRSSRSGYSFSVTGDNSVSLSSTDVRGKFNAVFDFIAQNGKDEYKLRVEELLNEAIRVATMTAATHSRLTCNWHVSHEGSEFDRRGGNLSLGAVVTLIRALDTRNIDAILQSVIEAISKGTPPQELTLPAGEA